MMETIRIKVSNLTELTNYIVDLFIKLGINKDTLPIIDGVDDILRTKKEKKTYCLVWFVRCIC